MNNPLFENSQCLNGYLHRYHIENEWEEGTEEICEICQDQRFYKVVNGQIDNNEYLEYHEREILTIDDRRYEHEYK